MGYRSIRVWRDLTDGHLYQAGETFPRKGVKVSLDRLSALESGNNMAGFPLIERVGEPEEKPEVAEEAEKPEEEPEAAERPAKRKRK